MAKYGLSKKNITGGVNDLPEAGHLRREALKVRQHRLDAMAEEAIASTDIPVYSVDPEALKEEPEILKHFDFAAGIFTVTNMVPGKVYFWCREEKNAIAQKKGEARMWLGAGAHGWELVGNCSCPAGGKHLKGCPYPESQDMKEADGLRRIGDTVLMRMDYDDYVKMHKRIRLVVQYKEGNFSESLMDFVHKYEGMVTVVSGNADPRDLYAQKVSNAGPLVKAGADERGRGITKQGR